MAVICKKCGLPGDLCPCGELEKEETRIIIRLETRRFSKTSTMIEGIDPKVTNMHNIVKNLKANLHVGELIRVVSLCYKVTIVKMLKII